MGCPVADFLSAAANKKKLKSEAEEGSSDEGRKDRKDR